MKSASALDSARRPLAFTLRRVAITIRIGIKLFCGVRSERGWVAEVVAGLQAWRLPISSIPMAPHPLRAIFLVSFYIFLRVH